MLGGPKRPCLVGVRLLGLFRRPCFGRLLEREWAEKGPEMPEDHRKFFHDLLNSQTTICQKAFAESHDTSSSSNLDSVEALTSPAHLSRHESEVPPEAKNNGYMMETPMIDLRTVVRDLAPTHAQESFNFDFTLPPSNSRMLSHTSQIETSPFHHLPYFDLRGLTQNPSLSDAWYYPTEFEWGSHLSSPVGNPTSNEKQKVNQETSPFNDSETKLEGQEAVDGVQIPLEAHNLPNTNDKVSFSLKPSNEKLLDGPLVHHSEDRSYFNSMDFKSDSMPTVISSNPERSFDIEIGAFHWPVISPTTSIDVAKDRYMPNSFEVFSNEGGFSSTKDQENSTKTGKHQLSWENVIPEKDSSAPFQVLDSAPRASILKRNSNVGIPTVRPFLADMSGYNLYSPLQNRENKEFISQSDNRIMFPSHNFVSDEIQLWEALTQDQPTTPFAIRGRTRRDFGKEGPFHHNLQDQKEKTVDACQSSRKSNGSEKKRKLSSQSLNKETLGQSINIFEDFPGGKQRKERRYVENSQERLEVIHSPVYVLSGITNNESSLPVEVGDGLDFVFCKHGKHEISESQENEYSNDIKNFLGAVKKETKNIFFELQPAMDIWTDEDHTELLFCGWKSYLNKKINERYSGQLKLQAAAETFFYLADKEASETRLEREIESMVEDMTLNLCRNLTYKEIEPPILKKSKQKHHQFILQCMEQVRDITKGLLLLVRIFHTIFRDTKASLIGIRMQQWEALKFAQTFWKEFKPFQEQAVQQYSWISKPYSEKGLVDSMLCTLLTQMKQERSTILDKRIAFKLGTFWCARYRDELFPKICLGGYHIDRVWIGFINAILVCSGSRKRLNGEEMLRYKKFRKLRVYHNPIEAIVSEIEKSKITKKLSG